MLETQLRREGGAEGWAPSCAAYGPGAVRAVGRKGPERTGEGAPGPGLQPCQHFKPSYPTVMPLRHLLILL